MFEAKKAMVSYTLDVITMAGIGTFIIHGFYLISPNLSLPNQVCPTKFTRAAPQG